MVQSCIFRGPSVGAIVIGCCGGKERKDPIYTCLHQQRVTEYTSESIQSIGIANVEVEGKRQPLKVASCQSCSLKLVQIRTNPVPILNDSKPKTATQIAIEDLRSKKMPANPRQRTIVLDCNLHGIGDTVMAAWIAEGAKSAQGDDPHVVLCAKNDRKQMLEMFGQQIHHPVAPAANNGIGGFYLNGQMGQGSPPFILARARKIGLKSTPTRPNVSITPDLKAWARQPSQQSQVLLFPQSSQVSRTWPVHKWLDLHDKLAMIGMQVRVAEQFPTILKQVPLYTDALTLPQMVAMIEAADLVIGNDSGPMHIAGTLNKAAIAIHGMTSDVTFAHCPSIRTVQAERRLVPCAGCWLGWGYQAEVCERSCKALESIPVSTVVRMAREIIGV